MERDQGQDQDLDLDQLEMWIMIVFRIVLTAIHPIQTCLLLAENVELDRGRTQLQINRDAARGWTRMGQEGDCPCCQGDGYVPPEKAAEWVLNRG